MADEFGVAVWGHSVSKMSPLTTTILVLLFVQLIMQHLCPPLLALRACLGGKRVSDSGAQERIDFGIQPRAEVTFRYK